MASSTCGIRNPDATHLICELPAGHGRIKALWMFGQWMDHLCKDDQGHPIGWVVPPDDERHEAVVEALGTAIFESEDFIRLLLRALEYNGYQITPLPSAPTGSGTHTAS